MKFDPETLETLVVEDEPGDVTTAHPYIDPDTSEKISYAAELGRSCSYEIYLEGRERETPAKITVEEPAYMHSFAATESYVVLVEFPYRIDPFDTAFGSSTVAECYSWNSDKGTRFLVVERGSGEVVLEPRAEAFFAFHHVNNYEDDDRLVIDVAAYPDAEVIDELYLDRVRREPPLELSGAEIRRTHVDLASGDVEHKTLYPSHFELPRVHPYRWGRRYRYAYGVGNEESPPETMSNQLVKYDSEEEATTWTPECFPSEPVFEPRPDRDGEDDGVVLTVVLDPETEESALVALDAESMEEVARADVEQTVPFESTAVSTAKPTNRNPRRCHPSVPREPVRERPLITSGLGARGFEPRSSLRRWFGSGPRGRPFEPSSLAGVLPG